MKLVCVTAVSSFIRGFFSYKMEAVFCYRKSAATLTSVIHKQYSQVFNC